MTAEAKRILLITAHPDDADVHAGGTIARWVDDGYEVHGLIVTSGDKGHDDPAMTRDDVIALRRAERRAAQILGVRHVTFLNYEDGELAWAGPSLAEDITRAIREVRPDIALTHDPYAGPPRYTTYQLHPDHRAVGFAAIDAVYFRAPGPLYYPAPSAAGLRPHRVAEVLLIMGDHHDHFVDVGTTFGRKLEAVRAHASQWGKHPDLEAFLRTRAQRVGETHGMALAEGFKRLAPT
jgi:LmbE family N-acetylglucosaminyl deacetylase